jgi:hypothetical protein
MLLHVYPLCLLFCDGEKKEGGRDGNDGLLVLSMAPACFTFIQLVAA